MTNSSVFTPFLLPKENCLPDLESFSEMLMILRLRVLRVLIADIRSGASIVELIVSFLSLTAKNSNVAILLPCCSQNFLCRGDATQRFY